MKISLNNTNLKSPSSGDLEELIIIADDITGAAEIAGVCLNYGLTVSMGINEVPTGAAKAKIIATDSRSMSNDQAYLLHLLLAKKIRNEYPDAIVFKKCDSVLRGYVLSEMKALSEGLQIRKLLIQPANPFTGRKIINGEYFINQSPLHETGFNSDPEFPANTSDIKTLLNNRSKLHSISIRLTTGKIDKFDSDGLYIPDCANITDLKNSTLHVTNQIVVGGSAVFFAQFLEYHGFQQINIEKTLPSFIQNYLIISGTTHPESRQYLNNLIQKGFPYFQLPEIYSDKISKSQLQELTEKLISTYIKEHKLIILTPEKINNSRTGATLTKQNMAKTILSFLKNEYVEEIFIEGGASTFEIFKQSKLAKFIPVNEYAAGVVRLKCTDKENLHFTIKPGSYKWPEIFG